ncbi:flagellar basal body P-ring protein FlgI [Dissulfurirhabdus thermomarina]|uniref:Flagellar P-ring protein n=1 Tax=Dissulfurirhabdus thermomarina TaxID=1765737 RepID=A0A6N9TLZ9_DISTH|nr:flagellar basal body P-ring protein FlgI [Dissulfurirhabdus thermomarina]NDY42265.1 flagellar basal body P-ring protein FlgI [Dissulfurirhabdus thermomarina]NMX22770.1 flagellar basal body P-ring protein FlgI [Dissulfurirhabdus thermomarina]
MQQRRSLDQTARFGAPRGLRHRPAPGKNLPPAGCLAAVLAALCLLAAGPASAARLKDVADLQGARANQLVGYGLVVGLSGSGDGTQAEFTIQSIVNMMERMGINVDPNAVKVKNVAGVMVTAQLPPFAKVGQKIDVLVSSMGDAKSLQGGTLLLTPLKGVDGQVYALAQGAVSLGGFGAGGAGAGVQKNHLTAGRIPNGATVERQVPLALDGKGELRLTLHRPDFTTAHRAAGAVNRALGAPLARALDAETLAVAVPPAYRDDVVGFLARVETVEVAVDNRARVVLDERTGTVVMGSQVRLSTVAVAHGNLSIQIRETPRVSQPPPFSRGQTVVTPETQVGVKEEAGGLVVLDTGATIGELVRALNAVGVTPRDLIAILHSVKAAGALQADLEVI